MNLNQAEAIVALYEELIKSIDKSKIILPKSHTYRQDFTHDHIEDITLEEGHVKITWSRYAGCNEYDTQTTYQQLNTLFDY